METTSTSDIDEDDDTLPRTPSRSPSVNALSALLRRVTLVTEHITNARSSSDDFKAVSSGFELCDENENRLVKA